MSRPSAELMVTDDHWYAISDRALRQADFDFNFPAQTMTIDAALDEV